MRRFTLLFTLLLGCATPPDEGASTQQLTQENGIWENGLTTNGIWENGIWENGIWENGIWENGIWENGIWENGIWENGIWENGIWENGIWENGIWENGLWQENPTALDTLRTNAYTRKLMQYVFSCAVPPGRSKIIDPGRTGACVSDPAISCVHDTDCGTDDICLGGELQLDGGIGVGINQGADLAEWDLPNGTCDQTCQRWTSACLLARTNAYGVHVQISMRAPDDAPDAIKLALQTSAQERTDFSHREGTYFGNIFAANATGTPVELFACAGPESNVPEITNRFCSSQGDNGPINVVGSCLPAGAQPGVCTNTLDPDGAIGDCTANSTLYSEAITVFLKTPISVCGNNVCEDDEDVGAANACPNDCHPTTWGSSVPSRVAASAVDPIDESVVRIAVTDQEVDMGGGMLPATGHIDLVYGRYDSGGHYQSSKRVTVAGLASYQYSTPKVIVAPSGAIYVVGYRNVFTTNPLFVIKLTRTGSLVSGFPKYFGGTNAYIKGSFHLVTQGIPNVSPEGFALAVGANDELYIAGEFLQTVQIGTVNLTATGLDQILIKLASNGTVTFAKDLGVVNGSQAMTVDMSGNLWMTSGSNISKRNSIGTLLLSRTITSTYMGAPALDTAGNVYVTGAYGSTVDFGDGPVTPYTSQTLFVASYTSNLATLRWKYVTPQTPCETPAPECNPRYGGYKLGFDKFGNVVAGAMGGSKGGGTIDLGAGPMEGYGTMDIYAVALAAATGDQQWAKHIPLILDGVLQDMTFNRHARIVISGLFGGSMLADGVLIVSSIPEDNLHFDGFLASFDAPTPDLTPPVIEHVPHHIYIAAGKNPNGGQPGAIGWYMPPTARDDSTGGTNVHCDHLTTEWLPLGDTTVHCTGYDAFGNNASTSFVITVKDIAGPKFSGLPKDHHLVSPGPNISFQFITAVDAVDGVRPVTCVPGGGVFPLGDTNVTCTSSDLHGHTSTASFVVTVVDNTPPVVTPPANMVVEAQGANGSKVVYPNATAVDNHDGVVPASCNPKSGSLFHIGTTTVVCTATDAGGNVGWASFTVLVRDTLPPVLTIPSFASAQATSATGANYSYAASAYDAVSGPVPVTCNHSSGSHFPLNQTVVTCTATDALGHTATGSFTVWIVVAWNGIQQPVNADGTSVFKVGTTINFRFTLAGSSAGITNVVANLSGVKTSGTPSGPINETVSLTPPDSGTQFHYTTGGYVFNLGSTGMAIGTWRFTINMHDGITRVVDLSVR